jgi:hypothetical protein
MPSWRRVKIKLVRSLPLRLTGLVILIAATVAGLVRLDPVQPFEKLVTGSTDNWIMQVHDQQYVLEVAETEGARSHGLGGRSALPPERGMVFIFPGDTTERCFWMKGMRFAIDIIWTDSAKKVVHVERNVSPDTYPDTFCAPAKYVVELRADEAANSSIDVGTQLSF